MEQFYSRLWGEKKTSKLEALRQAQLFVLRNPGAVVERARQLRAELLKRGVAGPAPEARGFGKRAVALPAGSLGARSHPAWWAAFVLSGTPAVP
jgi:CHAT domain-containing protein